MSIKIGVFGGGGKMGAAVEQMSNSLSEKLGLAPFLFAGGAKESAQFSISVSSIDKVEEDVLADVDVWIDFSSPEGLEHLLKVTKKFKTPVVSGSTGLSDRQFLLLKKDAKTRPLFWASNMSLGLWAFRQALSGLKHIAHFDFAVEEFHHNQKKDKPSGTAKTIHKDLERILNKKVEAPVSFRMGGIFGVHNVYAASSNEVIMLQHQALNRTVFAEGALIAAAWLYKQKPGLYSMDELFNNSKKNS